MENKELNLELTESLSNLQAEIENMKISEAELEAALANKEW